MSTQASKPRVSRDQWLRAALDLFARVGERGLTIHQLAREVGVAKAGFYWHFKDRAALLDHLLDFWAREFTAVVTANTQLLELPPMERLLSIMELVDEYDLTQYDVHFRAWAAHDNAVAERVSEVFGIRLDMVRALLAEAGFEEAEIEMRAVTLVCYGSNERNMFGELSDRSRSRREQNWRSLAVLLMANSNSGR